MALTHHPGLQIREPKRAIGQLSLEMKNTVVQKKKKKKKCTESSELLPVFLIYFAGVPGLAKRLCIKGHPQSLPPVLSLDSLHSAGARLHSAAPQGPSGK